MQEEFKKIDIEIEYFKENGIITNKSILLWLQSRGVIRLGKFDEVLVRPDKGTEKLSARVYQSHLNLIEAYLNSKRGGVVKKVTLPVEDLPF